MNATSVLLVGAHGYGVRHLENLERLGDRVELVGVVDPQGPPAGPFGTSSPCWSSLKDAFASGMRPDVVIIATPTGTHFPLATLALEHGCDLYLEKPPVASMDQFEKLLALQAATGSAIQIGFQSFGSRALAEIARLGRPTSVATWASWVRDHAYWTRSAWAGKRSASGTPIVDGVATNPLSHAIATALLIAGARRREDVGRVDLELLRANAIEADDTSAVRVTLADGRVVAAGLTLCGAETIDPVIEVRTPAADAEFWYIQDRLRVGETEDEYERDDLFEQLLEHRTNGRPLSASLVDTGAYMEVLEAIRLHEPIPIGSEFVTRVGEGAKSHAVVHDVADWCARAARAGALFSELRAPWATTPRPAHMFAVATSDEEVLAVRDDGATVARTSSPRPHLHPVRTLEGVVVTDAHPEDHDWHLGISIGVQNVNHVNFWGGRTYTPDGGYRWLADHGTCRSRSVVPIDCGFRAAVDWVTPSGAVLLTDARIFTARAHPQLSAWTFDLEWIVTAGDVDVALGSPGTAGRDQAGYGGLAWRLPQAAELTVRSGGREGEAAVHGVLAASPLVVSGRFAEGDATIALAATDAGARADHWFVRMAAFPSIGSALAWDEELVLPAGTTTTRRYTGVVADGIVANSDIDDLLALASIPAPA